MSQKNSIIIIVVVLLVALGGLYVLTKKSVQAPVDFAKPVTDADKQAFLEQLAASSTVKVPPVSQEIKVLKALEASSTPVSVSEEQKIKILRSLENNSH